MQLEVAKKRQLEMKIFIGTCIRYIRQNETTRADFNNGCKGVFFALYAWNAGPVDGTEISVSIVDIGRYFPFTIDLSPERSREVTSEGQQALYQFEGASPFLFRKRELLNILVSKERLRYRDLCNKVKIIREFYKGDLVVVRRQVKSSRKYGVA